MTTNKPTHTPGPWTYTCTNAGEIGSKDKVGVDAPCGHVAIACRIAQNNGRDTFGKTVHSRRPLWEVKANARLIAAAPELLNALKRLEQAITHPDKAEQFAAVEAARAAILRAEGK